MHLRENFRIRHPDQRAIRGHIRGKAENLADRTLPWHEATEEGTKKRPLRKGAFS